MHRSVSVRTHRSPDHPLAGAPPPSSPTPTPRLQAKRNNASTTNRLLASALGAEDARRANDAASVASTCPTLCDTLSPPTPHKSLWRRAVLVRGDDERVQGVGDGGGRGAEPSRGAYTRGSRHPSSPKASSSPLVLFVVEGRLGVARVADRARETARGRGPSSRSAPAPRAAARLVRPCGAAGFPVALIAADEAALDASASSRLLAFDNASSADTNRRGASRSMNARVRSPTIRRNLLASSVIGVSLRSPSRKCASGVVSAKIKPHARDAAAGRRPGKTKRRDLEAEASRTTPRRSRPCASRAAPPRRTSRRIFEASRPARACAAASRRPCAPQDRPSFPSAPSRPRRHPSW